MKNDVSNTTISAVKVAGLGAVSGFIGGFLSWGIVHTYLKKKYEKETEVTYTEVEDEFDENFCEETEELNDDTFNSDQNNDSDSLNIDVKVTESEKKEEA